MKSNILVLAIAVSVLAVVVYLVITSTGGVFDAVAEKYSPKAYRFYSISKKLERALETDAYADSVRLATEYLALAEDFKDDWNYGNALHDANAALGMVAMRQGKPSVAAEYLLKAGNSPGSPQMDSFGPDLQLADSLLASGNRTVVIEYLKRISQFWAPEAQTISSVIEKIEHGEMIRLNRFNMCCHGD
ncbi:MAG: hypothetical protein V4812_01605 [Pseudomonadota bacterium]